MTDQVYELTEYQYKRMKRAGTHIVEKSDIKDLLDAGLLFGIALGSITLYRATGRGQQAMRHYESSLTPYTPEPDEFEARMVALIEGLQNDPFFKLNENSQVGVLAYQCALEIYRNIRELQSPIIQILAAAAALPEDISVIDGIRISEAFWKNEKVRNAIGWKAIQDFTAGRE